MKKILLLIVAPFVLLTALSAQITQEKADEIVLKRMNGETQTYVVYAKEKVQKPGATVALSAEEVIEFDYACWMYYINHAKGKTGDITGRYLVVNESNGNILEINTKNDLAPSGLGSWRIVSIENTDYSVWKSTPCDVVIEWIFYPAVNLLYIKTEPESFTGLPCGGLIHTMPSGSSFLPYSIRNDRIYPCYPPGVDIPTNMNVPNWRIMRSSENEMTLFYGSIVQGNRYTRYDFVCQTNFKGI